MYRVCFAGDSVFVIREIEPEAQVAPIWASFCGHMFAVAGLIHEMDQAIGNPGLRVVVAAGPLLSLCSGHGYRGSPSVAGTENRDLTSEVTGVGLLVPASIGHQSVTARASPQRSRARSISVWRSNRTRVAAPTHVLAPISSPKCAACL